MELACKLITKKNNRQSLNIKYINEFKNLNLSEKIKHLSPHEYIFFIKTKYVKSIAFKFGKIFVDDNKLGKAILMAYYISNYYDYIFKPIKTSADIKLVNASNILLKQLDKLLISIDKQSIYNFSDFIKYNENNLMDAIDHYYSLYLKWISNDILDNISKLFDRLMCMIKLYNTKIKYNKCCNNIIKEIKLIIKKMFLLNSNFAVKSLISNYDLFFDINNIVNIVWDNIKCNMKDYIHVFIIIIAEIRVKLLKSVNNVISKKNIYYNCDIDTIVKNIRDGKFNINEFNNILNILFENIQFDDNNKCIINYKEFNKETINDILQLFRYALTKLHS